MESARSVRNLLKVNIFTLNTKKEIISKINDLDTASDFMDKMVKNPEKFKDTVLMQRIEDGKFYAMPKSKVNQAEQSKKWRVY